MHESFFVQSLNNHWCRALCLCRRYGTKCGGCSQVISPTDLVRKARSKVFHLNCFTCIICNKQLSTGEELYILDESKFVCKEDYLSNSTGKDSNLLSSRLRVHVIKIYSILNTQHVMFVCFLNNASLIINFARWC